MEPRKESQCVTCANSGKVEEKAMEDFLRCKLMVGLYVSPVYPRNCASYTPQAKMGQST